MAMLSAVLLASENKNLRMENRRQKGKRAQRRTYIARGGVLLGAEGASRAQATQEEVAEAAAKRPRRALPKCSMCKSTEHNVRTCPRRQVTS